MKIRELFLLAGIVVLILLLLRTCNVSVGKTEIIRFDTVYLTVKDSSATAYKPNITLIQGARIPQGYITRVDSFVKFDKVYVQVHLDTPAIVRDFSTTKYYRDTIVTDFGSMTIMDSVRENRIDSRRWEADFKIPHITKTVTITEPPKGAVYFGINGLGSSEKSFIGLGPSLAFMPRGRERMFEVAALYTGNNVLYNFSYKVIISKPKK